MMSSPNRKNDFSALSFVFLFITLFGFLSSQVLAQTLRIYHIDVDQGDATLFVSPSGNTMLIDSGGNGKANRIKYVLKETGSNKIDHFVCTHYHTDHYGSIDEIAHDGNITIGEVYDRGDKTFLPQSKLTGDNFKNYQNAVGNRAEHLTRGETISLDPDMSITCISSGGVVLSEVEPKTGINENDMSISLLFKYGNFRYFIGGDIQDKTEEKIAERDLVMDVDVYQVNHHGSDTSSTLAFMQDLSPSVIIISNGDDGRYKHPRKETLDRFAFPIGSQGRRPERVISELGTWHAHPLSTLRRSHC